MAKVIINGSSATRYFPEHPERFTTFIVDLHPLLDTDEVVDVSGLKPELFRAIQHRHLDGRGVCKDVNAYFEELQGWTVVKSTPTYHEYFPWERFEGDLTFEGDGNG